MPDPYVARLAPPAFLGVFRWPASFAARDAQIAAEKRTLDAQDKLRAEIAARQLAQVGIDKRRAAYVQFHRDMAERLGLPVPEFGSGW